MPDLTQNEIDYLKAQGYSPDDVVSVHIPEEQPQAVDKQPIGTLATIGRTLKAHGGGMVSALPGAVYGGEAGGALGSIVPGIGTAIGAIVGSIGGGLATSFAGQKLTEKAEDAIEGAGTAQRINQEAEEAAKENPTTAAATDIIGSALGGGGSFSLRNPVLAAGQLLGRNAAGSIESQLGKEALKKVATSMLLNPAINTGIDLVTGRDITAKGIGEQVIGGALFSEQSRLAKMVHGATDTHSDEPLPEPAQTDKTETPTGGTSVFNSMDEQGNPLVGSQEVREVWNKHINPTPKYNSMEPSDAYVARTKYNRAKMNYNEDEARQLLADKFPSVTKENVAPTGSPVDVNKPTQPASTEPDVTEANKTPVEETDEDRLNKQAEAELAKQAPNADQTESKQRVPVKEQSKVIDASSDFDDAQKAYERELALNGVNSPKLTDLFNKMQQAAKAQGNVESAVKANNDSKEPLKESESNATQERLQQQDSGAEHTGINEDGKATEASRSNSATENGEVKQEPGEGEVKKSFGISLYDKIHDLAFPPTKEAASARELANAGKQVETTKQNYYGQTANTILGVMKKVGWDAAKDNAPFQEIREWENKNKTTPPRSLFQTLSPDRWRILQAVYAADRMVYDNTGMAQLALNQPVYNNKGTPRSLKQDPHAHFTAIQPKIIELLKNGTDSKGIAAAKEQFINNALSYGAVPEHAENLFAKVQKSVQGNMSNSGSNLKFFNGARMMQGIPLPKEWQIQDYARAVENYYGRRALDYAVYKHIESDPRVMATLGETKDAWKRPIPKSPNGSLAGNDAVRAMIDKWNGEITTKASKAEGSASALAATTFVSWPGIEMHKVATNALGISHFADNPSDLIKMATSALTNAKDGIEHAVENGVIRYSGKSAAVLLDNTASVADKISAIGSLIRKASSLGETIPEVSTGMFQAAVESVLPAKINRANNGDIGNQQSLYKLDPSYKPGKTYSAQDITKLASEAVAHTQGTHDLRTMPAWMLRDNEISGFFKLAHWSVAQTNKFMTDVVTPALRGNLKPLLTGLTSSAIAGYLIRQLREQMQGKEGPIPSLSEIGASNRGFEGNSKTLVYNLASACQYAGFGGLIGNIAKAPLDMAFKNQPQGMVFPLDEIATDLASQLSKFTTAAVNDPQFNIADASVELMKHIFTTDIQLTRMGYNQAINNGLITGTAAEKKEVGDKLQQLRRFETVEGLPFDEQTPSQKNDYMDMAQKQFKKEPDLNKAMAELPKIVQSIYKEYGNNPEVMMDKLKSLKENQYETFPSLKDKPLAFNAYMNYLTRLKGNTEANAELNDYMKHRIVNEVKSGVVP